jgi:hypothetical protein
VSNRSVSCSELPCDKAMERKNPSTAGTVNWEIYKEFGYKTKIVDYHYKTLIFAVFFNTANLVKFDSGLVVLILLLFL